MSAENCFIGGQPPGNGADPCCEEVGFFAERFNTTQSISTGVETKIICDTVLMDNGRGDFSLINSWFLVPFTGRYSFDCSFDLTTAAGGPVECRLYQNAIKRSDESNHPTTAVTTKVGASATLWCAAGDTIDFRVFQTTGFTATLVSCNNQISGALIYKA
jgi:hypothetical protein